MIHQAPQPQRCASGPSLLTGTFLPPLPRPHQLSGVLSWFPHPPAVTPTILKKQVKTSERLILILSLALLLLLTLSTHPFTSLDICHLTPGQGIGNGQGHYSGRRAGVGTLEASWGERREASYRGNAQASEEEHQVSSSYRNKYHRQCGLDNRNLLSKFWSPEV